MLDDPSGRFELATMRSYRRFPAIASKIRRGLNQRLQGLLPDNSGLGRQFVARGGYESAFQSCGHVGDRQLAAKGFIRS